MGYKTLHNLKLLGAILAISAFFFFSFTTSTQACDYFINVTTNLEAATFTINGPESYSGSGTYFSVRSVYLPPGSTYTIVFGDVEGYITPSSYSYSQTSYSWIGPTATMNFSGEYYPQENKNRNIIVGAGPGSRNLGLVKVFNYDGTETGVSFIAHKYKYGVNVASGDIDGDGIDEIITGVGPGPQNPAEVNVFDSNGNQLTGLSVTAYKYKYGVNVASADFDGDGRYEVITGAGAGPQNPAEVKVFVYDSIEQRLINSGIDFLAYNTKYGVKVAAGDIDGDGAPEIITERGPGPVYKGDIRRWEVNTSLGIGQWGISLIEEGERLSDYFDDSKDLEWDEVSGIWSAEGGQYSMIDVVAETIGLSVIDIETQNMTIEVDASELGDKRNQNFFIAFAYDEADTMIYLAGGWVGADMWTIGRTDYACRPSPNGSQTYASTSEVIDANTWYKLKVVISGDTVTLYADGIKKLSYTFPDGIPTGKIGLGGVRNHALFDNFSVVTNPSSEPDYGYSVNIASSDIDGDGIDEIIIGAGSRPNAPDDIKVINEDGTYLSEFRAGIYNYNQYGVNVASGDMDEDGVAEIVAGTGPGPNNEAFVLIFDADGVEKAYFMVLDTKYGANVAVGNFLGLEATE